MWDIQAKHLVEKQSGTKVIILVVTSLVTLCCATQMFNKPTTDLWTVKQFQAVKYSQLGGGGLNVIKLFTTVIYCHYIVIPSFCTIKQYFLGNYRGVVANYLDIVFLTLTPHITVLNATVIYHHSLTLEKVGTMVILMRYLILLYNIFHAIGFFTE